MAVNRDKPGKWKADIARSVDTYNDWFMKFAPKAFRETRIQTTRDVEEALRSTGNLTNIAPATMRTHPEILPTLRMSTCPPLAVDRLIGLASVSPNFVKCMEIDKKLPAKTSIKDADAELARIAAIIGKMADPDIFVWLSRKGEAATDTEIHRAATIVADQLCGAVANPIIRVNESGSSLVVCIHRTNHGVVEGESEPLCVSSSERARLFEPDRDSSRQN